MIIDSKRASQRRYYQKNRGRILEHQRQRIAANPSEHRKKCKEYRDRNPEKWRLQQAKSVKKRKASPRGWVASQIPRLRMRARQNSIPFDLTAEDIESPTHCPVLMVKLEYGSSGYNDFGPSIDRVIPSRGYVRGNVKVISSRANKLKNNSIDPSELRAVANYIEMELSRA